MMEQEVAWWCVCDDGGRVAHQLQWAALKAASRPVSKGHMHQKKGLSRSGGRTMFRSVWGRTPDRRTKEVVLQLQMRVKSEIRCMVEGIIKKPTVLFSENSSETVEASLQD